VGGYADPLVICPAALVRHWERQAALWAPSRRVKIVSYEKAVRRSSYLLTYLGPLIVDEAHRIKDPAAQRSQLVAEISQHARWTRFLTGTPMPNRPIELWTMLALCGATRLGYHDFGLKFAGARKDPSDKTGRRWLYTGATNLDELWPIVDSCTYYLRKEMALDLPERIIHMLAVDGTGTNLRDFAKYEFPAITGTLDITTAATIQRESALAKWPAVEEIVRDRLDDGEPLIVFAHHREIVERLMRLHPDAEMIIGGQDAAARQEVVDAFQRGEVPLLACNMSAAGEGLTLTRARRCIFAEIPWSPGTLDQCIDRLHRIGQDRPVIVELVVVRDSIDERIARRVLEKRDTQSAVLDYVSI
jgi:SWI/SNF-related matrix-associated actin-dependent regulator 1 of chromatin subfamily A